MRLVDGLQSAIMYRTGKPLHGRANVFVFHPLIIIYVVSTTLLLAAGGAQASTSQSDVEEAEKIVGRFLRNEAGSKWLASLAKRRSAPLTTQDLMKELRNATRPDGKVYRASMILSDSFDEQIRKGNDTVPILGGTENWKDILEHIEQQDDIICLYRKSTEETAKKADDWKKFLRTITPGYTVHLAIDTGSKYVICLKKIEVPETTTPEISSTQETPSTAATSEVTPSATSTSPSSTTPGNSETTPTPEILKNTKNESHVKLDFNDESCHDESQDGSEDCKEENSKSREGVADEIFEEDTGKIPKEGKEDGLTEGPEEYPSNFTHERRALNPPPAKRWPSYPANDFWKSIDSPAKTPVRINSESSREAECNRPIILVMQNGDVRSLGNLPGRHSQFSTQRHFGAANFPWIPPAPLPPPGVPYPPSVRVPYPPSLRIPPPNLSMINNMPPPIVYPPKIPSRPYYNFAPPNKFLRLPGPYNPYRPIVDVRTMIHTTGPQQIHSHNSQVVYHVPHGKMQRPVVKWQSIASHVKPRVRKPSIPQPTKINPPVPQSRQQNPYFVDSMRYPFGSYMPRRAPGQVFPDSMIRGPAKNPWWNPPARNIPLPHRRISNEAKRDQSVRQFLQKYQDPRASPRTSVYGSANQPFARQPAAPLRRIPQNGLQVDRLLRQNPMVMPQVYQRPNFAMYPNYPQPNGLVRPIRPCPIPWVPPYAAANPFVRCGNPSICPPTGNPLQPNSVPCQSPCDKPVKLQIVINGNVQEPLKVSVISEPGQRVEYVGSGKPMMPYGSRALGGITPLDGDPGDVRKDVDPDVLEVKKRIFDSKEDTKAYVDDVTEGSRTSKEKEDKVKDEKVSSGGSTTVESRILDDKNNSTTELTTEVTTESVKELEIGQRILHEVTTEATNSTVSAAVANTTLSTTTNSTTTNSTIVE